MTWPASMSGRPTFTCASCHVVFPDAETQRSHYQSGWHCYNLRRKTTDLPPVTETVFQQRLGQLTVQDERPKVEALECTACHKNFASENSFASHVKSKKHLDQVSKPHEIIPRKEIRTLSSQPRGQELYLDKDATEEEIEAALQSKLSISRRLKPEDCIFCNQSLGSFEENMEHMIEDHGLYIPDLDFVEDLPGLMAYLADKVGVAFCCLYCPVAVQPFQSLEACRRHMLDKGHLKIRFDEEGMQELADFYNWEEVQSDDDDEDYIDIDEELEDGDEYDDSVDEQEGALIISPDETELILPSGKRLGHRDYRRYYRQNLIQRVESSRPTRRSEHQALIARMSDSYVAAGLMQPAEQRKFIIDQRRDAERKKEWDQRLGARNNGLQEHFRLQLRQ
jgi:pre-60S factor REI1